MSSQTEDAQKDTDVAETLLSTGCALGPSPPGHMLRASLSSLPRAFLLPFFSRLLRPRQLIRGLKLWAWPPALPLLLRDLGLLGHSQGLSVLI